jgi:type IX secretion system PorP/SprF family membrane protein
MIKKTIFFAASLFLLKGLYGQENFFLNLNVSPVLLNPSFAGTNGLFRASVSYEGFSGFTGSNKQAAGLDVFISPINGGFALTHSDEYIGPLSRRLTSATYAQHFNFPEKHLTVIPSLQVGYGENTVSDGWILLTPWHVKNPVKYFKINSGMLLNYRKNFFAGIAINNINRPDIGFYDSYHLRIHVTFHSSYTFKMGPKSLLQFLLRFDDNQAVSNTHISANAILWKHLILGTGYSSDNEFSLIVGGRLNSFALQLVYNTFDANFSENLRTTYEVHLSCNLRKKDIRNDVPLFEKM